MSESSSHYRRSRRDCNDEVDVEEHRSRSPVRRRPNTTSRKYSWDDFTTAEVAEVAKSYDRINSKKRLRFCNLQPDYQLRIVKIVIHRKKRALCGAPRDISRSNSPPSRRNSPPSRRNSPPSRRNSQASRRDPSQSRRDNSSPSRRDNPPPTHDNSPLSRRHHSPPSRVNLPRSRRDNSPPSRRDHLPPSQGNSSSSRRDNSPPCRSNSPPSRGNSPAARPSSRRRILPPGQSRPPTVPAQPPHDSVAAQEQQKRRVLLPQGPPRGPPKGPPRGWMPRFPETSQPNQTATVSTSENDAASPTVGRKRRWDIMPTTEQLQEYEKQQSQWLQLWQQHQQQYMEQQQNEQQQQIQKRLRQQSLDEGTTETPTHSTPTCDSNSEQSLVTRSTISDETMESTTVARNTTPEPAPAQSEHDFGSETWSTPGTPLTIADPLENHSTVAPPAAQSQIDDVQRITIKREIPDGVASAGEIEPRPVSVRLDGALRIPKRSLTPERAPAECSLPEQGPELSSTSQEEPTSSTALNEAVADSSSAGEPEPVQQYPPEGEAAENEAEDDVEQSDSVEERQEPEPTFQQAENHPPESHAPSPMRESSVQELSTGESSTEEPLAQVVSSPQGTSTTSPREALPTAVVLPFYRQPPEFAAPNQKMILMRLQNLISASRQLHQQPTVPTEHQPVLQGIQMPQAEWQAQPTVPTEQELEQQPPQLPQVPPQAQWQAQPEIELEQPRQASAEPAQALPYPSANVEPQMLQDYREFLEFKRFCAMKHSFPNGFVDYGL